jgi:hygromycin-B 7''-O-kinase
MEFSANIEPQHFFKQILPNPSSWFPIAKDICNRYGIPAKDLSAFGDGVNLVALVNDEYVVKIFPPFHRHQWESEHRTLIHLHGQLTIPIPQHLGSGELENSWTYLLMTKVEGSSLESVWPTLTHQNKCQILFRIGQIMADTHSVAVGELESLEPNWDEFIDNQAKAAKQRHEKKGMSEHLLAQLEDWISSNLSLLEKKPSRVILTGEYTPFNLLASKKGDDYQLSSMIDFGDAMIGFAEYDLIGPSTFLCAGDPQLVTSLFEGYGYPFEDSKETIQRRLLLLLLLHRYSDLNSQVRIDHWDSKAKDFNQIASLIWPFSSPSKDLS